MALPSRLWLPHPPAEATPVRRGTPAWTMGEPDKLPGALTQRMRRRAIFAGEGNLPDREVLLDWFPAHLLPVEARRTRALRTVRHIHLLRLFDLGLADPRTAYAISEAPNGVDLSTLLRAAQSEFVPHFALLVVSALCRALLCLLQEQRRLGVVWQGHGRIFSSTVFVGWQGQVSLLAYSPPLQTSHLEATRAPELLSSERLLTPAADVYSLALLLRQCLPSSSLAAGPLSRLIAESLLPEAQQRPSLPLFADRVQAALFDLRPPLDAAAAIAEVVQRHCPRATSDLLDFEWPESTIEGFPALPTSQLPLADRAVTLSATWVMPTQAVRRPSDAQRARRLSLGLLSLVCLLGLAALVLWELAPDPQAAWLRSPLSPVAPVAWHPSRVSATRPVGLPAPPPLRLQVPEHWPLRSRIASVSRDPADAQRVIVDLRLTNPGRLPLAVSVASLVFVDETKARWVDPRPEERTVLAGHLLRMTLHLSPDLPAPAP